MKKLNIMIVLILSLMLIIMTSGISQAAVSGACNKCHTMHNSQDGSPMAEDDTGAATAIPYDFLTRGSCLGCHGLGDTTIGDAPTVFGIPGSTMTAGGTFNPGIVDIDPNDYTKVHNVVDIDWINNETKLAITSEPPGAVSGSLGFDIRAGDTATQNRFSCAGAFGCHGSHDPNNITSSQGIRGFHHGSDAYRYCQIDDVTPILGKGSGDWEAGGADETNHNIYSADTTQGISAFCGECHGLFHDKPDLDTATGTSSPFKRHPTNNLLSDNSSDWTMANVEVDYNNNPFSFQDPEYVTLDPNNPYTTSGARVACVSCHRAHGSEYPDILRFDYSLQEAGSTVNNGCLGCHERQRGQ